MSLQERRQHVSNSTDAGHRDATYQAIRDGIFKGTYGPNQRLTEMDLSAELGVSRQTVGIALVRLQQEGLVVSRPNRGASVRSVTVAEALRALRIREALEGVAAALAAEFVTAAELAEIDDLVVHMKPRAEPAALVVYSQQSARLHELVLKAARDQTLERMLASLNYALLRYQALTMLVPGRLHESLVEHRQIVKAIHSRSAADAEQAARRH
ncbi:MAG: GntR family transcriptional regulator, partial [Chloroflexi bacterium]|nr:GntR family transcriptional regulator [Chloroflexota bacterium]